MEITASQMFITESILFLIIPLQTYGMKTGIDYNRAPLPASSTVATTLTTKNNEIYNIMSMIQNMSETDNNNDTRRYYKLVNNQKDDDQYLLQDDDCKDQLMHLMLQAIYTVRSKVEMMEDERKGQRGKDAYKISFLYTKIKDAYDLLMRIYSTYHWQGAYDIADMTYLYERGLKLSIDIRDYLANMEKIHKNSDKNNARRFRRIE